MIVKLNENNVYYKYKIAWLANDVLNKQKISIVSQHNELIE